MPEARDAVPRRDLHERRIDRAALRHGDRAAGVEAAAARRIHRARHVALQDRALALAPRRIGRRCRREQRFGVRVARRREQRADQIESDRHPDRNAANHAVSTGSRLSPRNFRPQWGNRGCHHRRSGRGDRGRTNQNRLIGPSIVPNPRSSAAWKTQWINPDLINVANFQIAIFRRELDR